MPLPAKPQTPNLVQPAWKTCRFDGIASFLPGVWNGKPHSAEFVAKLAENFRKYSSGAKPYYTPYVSINHKDELQAGRVAAARLNGETLVLDADDVPEPVGAWRNAGGITQPSIEYFEPVYDPTGKLIDGFRKPDGSIEPGPVLKCLTLLGADAPAVKGLPPLPYATFSHAPRRDPSNPGRGARVRKFANVSTSFVQGATMDRAGIIAALQQMGFDVNSITDDIPDAFLKAVLDSMQAAKCTPVDATNGTGGNTGAQFADVGASTGAAGATIDAGGMGGGVQMPIAAGGQQQPSQIVLKFADNTPAGIAAGLGPVVAALQAQANATIAAIAADGRRNLAAINQATAQQAHANKFNEVTAFVNSLATPDAAGFVRLTPAQKPSTVALLMKCDAVTVRKFADGKTFGNELAEMKANLLGTLPKIRVGGERMQDRQAQPGDRTTALDPDRRARILGGSDLGRKFLAEQKK